MVSANTYVRFREYLSRPIVRPLLAPCRAPLVRNFLRWLDRTLLRVCPPDMRLRHEFNRWAEKGLGESMELDHMWLAEKIIPEMSLSSDDQVLDLGCGDGWACRVMASHLGAVGRIVGVDVSDEMVRRARMKSRTIENVAFLCGSAEHIPCRDELFSKVLSISSFYYFERQEQVLAELCRVVAPGGTLFLLTCLYKELPTWRSSARELRIPVHVCSADEYRSMLHSTGWRDVRTQELLRQGEPAGNAAGHNQALLITARRCVSGSATA
jgi:arsenite methyltransferase